MKHSIELFNTIKVLSRCFVHLSRVINKIISADLHK